MITIKNERIAVTVSKAAFDAILSTKKDIIHKHSNGDSCVETAHDQTRGHFLDRAMRVIGNTSELSLIKDNEVSDEEVEVLAQQIAILRYLDEHGKYSADETMMRGLGGHRMSLGMSLDWSNALKAEVFQSDLDAAKHSILTMRETEMRYRSGQSNGHGMVIEVIGSLPEQIGLCRVQRNRLLANDCIF